MPIPYMRPKVPDYGKALGRRGEVEIGQRARHRWWRSVLLGLLGVLLLVAAGWLYSSLTWHCLLYTSPSPRDS